MHNPELVIIPPEVFQDHRLTLIETRVLCALFSFRNRETNLCCPKRVSIAARSGYQAVEVVSRAMRGLKDKGWLTTEQHRGPNKYVIHIPKVTDPVTMTDPVTVTESVTETVTDPVTPKQIKEQIRRKEKVQKEKPAPKADPTQLPPDVDPEAWTDLMQHRKDIRKPVTELAAKKLAKTLATLPADIQRQTVDRSISNGWTGVFPDKHNGSNHAARKESPFDHHQRMSQFFQDNLEQAFRSDNADSGGMVYDGEHSLG